MGVPWRIFPLIGILASSIYCGGESPTAATPAGVSSRGGPGAATSLSAGPQYQTAGETESCAGFSEAPRFRWDARDDTYQLEYVVSGVPVEGRYRLRIWLEGRHIGNSVDVELGIFEQGGDIHGELEGSVRNLTAERTFRGNIDLEAIASDASWPPVGDLLATCGRGFALTLGPPPADPASEPPVLLPEARNCHEYQLVLSTTHVESNVTFSATPWPPMLGTFTASVIEGPSMSIQSFHGSTHAFELPQQPLRVVCVTFAPDERPPDRECLQTTCRATMNVPDGS